MNVTGGHDRWSRLASEEALNQFRRLYSTHGISDHDLVDDGLTVDLWGKRPIDNSKTAMERYLDEARELIDFIDKFDLDILCSNFIRGETLVSIGIRYGYSDSYIAKRRNNSLNELRESLAGSGLRETVPGGEWVVSAPALRTTVPDMFRPLEQGLYEVSLFDLLVLGEYLRLIK